MRWLRISPRQIRTEDHRFVVSRDGDTGPYWAFGPKGSQPVHYIRPRAAYTSGRARWGPFKTGDEAKAACENYQRQEAPDGNNPPE